MTTKRKAISKKTRFEVFKRDGFTCQYCGAHPPSIILHVDHIHPVAAGGGNDMDNLVTSCQDCNAGKSANLLSDVPQSLQDKAKEIIEREIQIQGYEAAVGAKRLRIFNQARDVCDFYEGFHQGYTLTEKSIKTICHFIETLGKDVVEDAMSQSLDKEISRDRQFRYFCGICWNRIREAS